MGDFYVDSSGDGGTGLKIVGVTSAVGMDDKVEAVEDVVRETKEIPDESKTKGDQVNLHSSPKSSPKQIQF